MDCVFGDHFDLSTFCTLIAVIFRYAHVHVSALKAVKEQIKIKDRATVNILRFITHLRSIFRADWTANVQSDMSFQIFQYPSDRLFCVASIKSVSCSRQDL